MPRYYFHFIHPDEEPVRDEEGSQFEDDVSARREGMQSLGDLIKETGTGKSMPFRVSVQIVRKGYGIIDIVTAHLSSQAQT